jgi:preprotein translocase subunit YajC
MPLPLVPLVAPFAQASPGADGGNAGFMMLLSYMVPIAVLFYFMILRPQQQQQRKQQQMLAALKKNDRVLTSAGIYGTVVSIDADAQRVVLRVDDDRGVKLVFNKASVAQVLEPAAEKAEKPKAADEV